MDNDIFTTWLYILYVCFHYFSRIGGMRTDPSKCLCNTSLLLTATTVSLWCPWKVLRHWDNFSFVTNSVATHWPLESRFQRVHQSLLMSPVFGFAISRRTIPRDHLLASCSGENDGCTDCCRGCVHSGARYVRDVEKVQLERQRWSFHCILPAAWSNPWP